EDAFRPAVSRRAQLIDRARRSRAPLVRHAVEVSGLVENHAIGRVVPVLAVRCESVKNALRPAAVGGRELENDALVVGAAVPGYPVHASIRAEGEGTNRVPYVIPSVIFSREAVQRSFDPGAKHVLAEGGR